MPLSGKNLVRRFSGYKGFKRIHKNASNNLKQLSDKVDTEYQRYSKTINPIRIEHSDLIFNVQRFNYGIHQTTIDETFEKLEFDSEKDYRTFMELYQEVLQFEKRATQDKKTLLEFRTKNNY